MSWYITTSIPYVNGKPHIGFALEILLADALARYQRISGRDVYFLTGTDDNSLTNVRAAEREGVEVAELVERNTYHFLALKSQLDLTHDDFIRTSVDPRHRAGAVKLWLACNESGDIYRQHYRGLYCVGCERFYQPDELSDALCPLHFTAPEMVDEDNYFFRLTRYADELLELISSGGLEVVPETRRNEALSLIRGGLEDFSISRSAEHARGWGIPVPGDPTQVMYVWFDALANYITALGYEDEGELFERYWAGSGDRIHVIGKDIIRFHAVYWPAMLLSAGLPLPKSIFVHGHITVAGRRMSTTVGNVIDPIELIDRFGTDGVRYLLLKLPALQDPDVTIEQFERTYVSDLADQLGNLVSRVTAMVQQYFAGKVPSGVGPLPLSDSIDNARSKFDEAMNRFVVDRAVGAVFDLVAEVNRYVVEVSPWKMQPGEQLESVIRQLVLAVREIALLCRPIMPSTADEILRRVGDRVVVTGPPLFPKS